MARQVIISDRLARLDAPASHGIAAGGLVFTGGMVGLDAAGTLVGVSPGRPDIEAQIEQALRNVAIVLEELGSAPGRLAKIKASFPDWSVYGRCRRRYGALLERPYPAWSAVGAVLRQEGAIVEIEGIAGLGTAPVELQASRWPAPAPDRPESQAGTRLGNLVFTNGALALDAGGVLVGAGDLRAQAEHILDNIAAALGAAGAGCADILKVNGTTQSWHGWGAYNEIYNKYFREPYATRASIQGTLPIIEAMIGIEAVAALGGARVIVESVTPGLGHLAVKRRADTLYSPRLPPAQGPHSHAVRVGDLVWVAGEAPFDEAGHLVGLGDLRAQTRKTLENIATALNLVGCGMDDIVKTNVSLLDLRQAAMFDAEYARFFTAPYPARVMVGTGLGQPSMLVEIEAIAVAGAASSAVAIVGVGS